MIEYQRLVSALADWRARNGLPTNPPEFTSAGSPGLAPPFARPESIVEVDEVDYEGEYHEVEEASVEVAAEVSDDGSYDDATAAMGTAYSDEHDAAVDYEPAIEAGGEIASPDEPADAEQAAAGDEDDDYPDLEVGDDMVAEEAAAPGAAGYDDDEGFDASEATVVAAEAMSDEQAAGYADEVEVDEVQVDAEMEVDEVQVDAEMEVDEVQVADHQAASDDGHEVSNMESAGEMEVGEGFDVLEESEETAVGQLPGDDDGNLPPDLPPPPDDDKA